MVNILLLTKTFLLKRRSFYWPSVQCNVYIIKIPSYFKYLRWMLAIHNQLERYLKNGRVCVNVSCSLIYTNPYGTYVYTILALLTHWGRVTHICTGNLTFIGSDNGLSPALCQAIIWTNAGTLLNGPSGTNFSGIVIAIHIFRSNKMHLKMS